MKSGKELVYVIDEGSVFDAPLDKIWKYLSSQEHRHTTTTVINREVSGNSVELTVERKVMGNPVMMKIRNTLYPPVGYAQEYLEGPLAGSKAFLYYTPKGDKTEVSVVGSYVAQGMDETQTREIILSQSSASFNEDNANLKSM